MSALDVLRQIKLNRQAKGPQKVIEWGSAECVNEAGIENLSRRELRNHLEARDLSTTGTRLELIERLRASIAEEQLNNFAYKETIDTEFLIQADLEERGSVYTIGCNTKGQLGLGDLNARTVFTVIPCLRGVHVSYIVANSDLCYAVTEEHDVYVWGGGGSGRSGINPNSLLTGTQKFGSAQASANAAAAKGGKHSGGNSNNSKIGSVQKQTPSGSISKGSTGMDRDNFHLFHLCVCMSIVKSKADSSGTSMMPSYNWLEPVIIKDLAGEEIENVVIGSSHCMANGRYAYVRLYG